MSKKKACTLKIFNYLQNNYTSNYDYHSVEDKSNELLGDSWNKMSPILVPSSAKRCTNSRDLVTILICGSEKMSNIPWEKLAKIEIWPTL